MRQAEIEAENKIKLTKAWKEVHSAIEEEEKAERDAILQARKEHQAYLLKQVQEKELRAAREAAAAVEADKIAAKAQEEDDALFNDTVQKFVAHEANKGHNPKGVARALHKVQKEPLLSAHAFF